MKRLSLRCVVAVLLLSSATVAQATTKFWKNSVGSGNWSNGNNWSNVSAAGVDNGGAPGINDTVRVSPTDGAARTITYDAFSIITHLEVDLTGAGAASTTFSMPGNNLTASSEYIGYNGRGVFNHSGGTNNVGGSGVGLDFLDVGVFAAAVGTYNLSGAGAISSGNSEYVGDLGTGFFNQTGGTNTINGAGHHLYLGFNGSGSGTYTISGGSLTVNSGDVIVGNSGTGTLTISGQASVHVANNLHINNLSTVNMNGGTLRFNTASGLNRLNYTAGTIRLAGDRSTDFAPVTTLFPANTIPSGKGLIVEGGLDVRNTFTVNGGTLSVLSPNFRVVAIGTVGTLAVTNGGTATASTDVLIGAGATGSSRGAVTVSGAGSSLTSTGGVFIGSASASTLQITGGGSVTSAGSSLGNGTGETFSVTVSGPGSSWTINGDLSVGSVGFGSGTLTIQNQGLVHVGNLLNINGLSTVNLDGGTLRFAGIDPNITILSRLQFNSGTIQLGGDFTIGTDYHITQYYGAAPTIPTGKGLTIEGTATLSKPLTIAGGTFKANALVVAAGGALDFDRGVLELDGGVLTGLPSLIVPTNGEFRARGVQPLRITGAAGSTITATGNLTLGNAAAVNGFGTQGTLAAGANTVTLLDSNDVVFDSLALATLGSGASPGAISAANGLTLDFGGNFTGFGTVTTPNNVAKPLINNGHITGNSGAQRITLPGYVKGAGTFDNVNFTGTFSPGLSPALTIVGSITLTPTNTLIMELGGTSRGGQYDAILASGNLGLGGVMNVTLIDGFNPAAGHTFDLFDWATLSGTFSTINLPALTAGLAWNTSLLYSTGVLEVVSPGFQAADFDEDGDVDGNDLTRWRNNFGTGTTHMLGDADGDGDADGSDFLVWQRQLGTPPSVGATAAVPEPTSMVLTISAVAGILARRRLF